MESDSSSHPKVFPLVVQQTYFDKGFFNVTVAFDKHVRQSEGPVRIFLGIERQSIEGRIDRSANLNHTARVIGGAQLRAWFQQHTRPMQTVYVDLSSFGQIQITLEVPVHR